MDIVPNLIRIGINKLKHYGINEYEIFKAMKKFLKSCFGCQDWWIFSGAGPRKTLIIGHQSSRNSLQTITSFKYLYLSSLIKFLVDVIFKQLIKIWSMRFCLHTVNQLNQKSALTSEFIVSCVCIIVVTFIKLTLTIKFVDRFICPRTLRLDLTGQNPHS